MTSQTSENKPDLPFAFPSYEDWLAIARHELDGADPAKKLIFRKGDLEIYPFYVAPRTETEKTPLLKPASQPYSGARNWINTPKIKVTVERKANELALSHLNSGAEGLLFDCSAGNVNPVILLNEISLPDCSVSFLVNKGNISWLSDFRHFVENNFDKKKITGCIFWQSNEFEEDIVNAFSGWPKFHSLGIIVSPQQDAIDEIAQSLKNAVELVHALSEKNIDTQTILDQISFSVAVGTDFFLEIAKLKSLRNLWYQIRGAYNVSNSRPLYIHAQSNAWTKEAFQPHGNMIKSTTAAMAAIAGGCDGLTVGAEDDNNDTMRRVAINVSSVLREESHFTKVADPTAGSYYINSLINQLSEKAWSKFQSLIE